MDVLEVSPREYDLTFKKALCFNKADFNLLNANNCDELFFLFFRDTKIRMGIAGGVTNGHFKSPFSAPFGGFSVLDQKLNIKHIEESVEALESFCRNKNFKSIEITLPPLFYSTSIFTKITHVLYQKNWRLDQFDLNYFFNFSGTANAEDLKLKMSDSARNKLSNSQKYEFQFVSGKSSEMLMEAFEIIRINREAKGYPLKMSLNQMLKTSEVIPATSFLVKYNDSSIASAIVYKVNARIPLVVYWGDLSEYSNMRTMNFLTYKIFEHYFNKGCSILDVGTAMIDNIPNYGLCEFKESLGCSILPRTCFIKSLT